MWWSILQMRKPRSDRSELEACAPSHHTDSLLSYSFVALMCLAAFLVVVNACIPSSNGELTSSSTQLLHGHSTHSQAVPLPLPSSAAQGAEALPPSLGALVHPCALRPCTWAFETFSRTHSYL